MKLKSYVDLKAGNTYLCVSSTFDWRGFRQKTIGRILAHLGSKSFFIINDKGSYLSYFKD